MSLSSGIDKKNPDADLRGRFYPDLIPWEADPRGDMTLGAVLQNGNSANNPDTGLPQDATDFKILGCETIFAGEVFQGNNLSIKIGDTLDNLQIKGGTNLGSLLVGNGLNTEELVCPTTNTTATTNTVYNWLSLANGQSKSFLVSDGTLYQLGYSITIVYSGSDSITGTVTAVAGNLITITITSFASQAYAPATLITTTPPDPSTATSGGGDPVFIFNPAVCTPTTIPANSFLLTGLCYLYGAPPVVGSSNISLTAIASPPAINGTTNIFSIPMYENPPVSTSAFSFGTDGCFILDGTSVTLASNAGGNQLAFGFPTGGSFIDQDFTGSIDGYSLPYTPDGVITINSKLVLTADNTKPLGVFWGVDAQGVGTVTSVSAGNNIVMSGSLSAPVVNLQQPLTSTLGMGSVALTDKNGASGTSGQYLSAGAGGETLWATLPTKVSSISAGNNIDITGTATVPIVALDSPLTATLALGTQNITGSSGSITLTNGTSTSIYNASNLSFVNGASFVNSTFSTAGVDTNYFEAGVASSNADLTTNVGNSELLLSSTNIPTGTAHLLRNECPLVGNARIQHSSIGIPAKNLEIQSDGYIEIKNPSSTNNIFCGSAGLGININCNSGGLGLQGQTASLISQAGITINSAGTAGNTLPTTFTNALVGGQANPIIKLENTNATGSVAFEVYKNKPTAGVNGDVLFNQSVYGKDSGNAKQEYTRISHTIRDNIAGTEDGSIEFSAFRAGAVNTFIQINGVDNEVNVLKNIDMGGNSVITNTGDMTISTTTSAGTGLINIFAKADVDITGTSCAVSSVSGVNTGALYTNAGSVEIEATNTLTFTGAGLQSATSGGNSGQHLVITLNGVQYKIRLENP